MMLGIIGFVIESRSFMTNNVIVTQTSFIVALMDYLEGKKVQPYKSQIINA